MTGRSKGVLRLVAIVYFPVVAVGTFFGYLSAILLFIPSVLRQIITGYERDHEQNPSVRFRLMKWFEDWRRFVLLGQGDMPWKP